MVTWFAGLFYLPRLFVYHAGATDAAGIARFRVMEQRLFAIMSIGAVVAVLFGVAMVVESPGYLAMGWLRAKVLLVAVLVGYHACCYQLMLALRAGSGAHSARWYRMFNELPTLLLVAIVVLAVVKPSI
jgi:protoporphyrinogen IX oxidase